MIPIVFHGENAASFSNGFAFLLDIPAEVAVLPDALDSPADRAAYAGAEAIIGTRFHAALPRPDALRLFQVPGAGYDAVDLAALPGTAVVCNCFGHEQAIAEYVMAALLARTVPLADADARLRRGNWAYTGPAPRTARMASWQARQPGCSASGTSARRSHGGPRHSRCRSPSPTAAPSRPPPLVDRAFPLGKLPAFWASADSFVVSVPLVEETRGIVGAAAFAAIRPHAARLNVGRGATVDEHSLFRALQGGAIAGAMIDTWYRYPSPGQPGPTPSAPAFKTLPNLVMTPHMSGWTAGTIRRRQVAIASNIRKRHAGEQCENVVRPAPVA